MKLACKEAERLIKNDLVVEHQLIFMTPSEEFCIVPESKQEEHEENGYTLAMLITAYPIKVEKA